MRPVVKGLLIGCTAVLILAVVAIVAAVRFVSSKKEQFRAEGSQIRARAQEFGRSVSEPACVAEAMRQFRENGSIANRLRVRLWLTGCLETSTPERDFCGNVPPKDAIARTVAWRLGECARLGFPNDNACTNILASVQDYCEGNARAAKVR